MDMESTNGQVDTKIEQRLSEASGKRLDTEPLFQGSIGTDEVVVVCGAGGFIGGHLVADLLRQGFEEVRAIDIKPPNQW
ncbi:tRNA A37 threonylcarbamoyladenosine dehydratase, partial [Salinibacter ruber]